MVYIIHLDTPLHHCRHYCGYTADIRKRFVVHQRGDRRNSSKLMSAIHAAGIAWRISMVYMDGDRDLEKRIKREKHTSRHCPICNPKLEVPALPKYVLDCMRWVLPSEETQS